MFHIRAGNWQVAQCLPAVSIAKTSSDNGAQGESQGGEISNSWGTNTLVTAATTAATKLPVPLLAIPCATSGTLPHEFLK